MATRKITPDMIDKMVELYNAVGTFAAVAKEMGVSASTASKYIKKALEEMASEVHFNSISIDELPEFNKDIKEIFHQHDDDYAPLFELTEEEKLEIQDFFENGGDK